MGPLDHKKTRHTLFTSEGPATMVLKPSASRSRKFLIEWYRQVSASRRSPFDGACPESETKHEKPERDGSEKQSLLFFPQNFSAAKINCEWASLAAKRPGTPFQNGGASLDRVETSRSSI
jgi:hypothetical protein